uniref:Fgenesh protein 35 n=1 Tax=Beta vulgaris TaxID=161934 RepID=Q20CE1_BETVU|nr:Fgenesh protein 35 [Beta vulgaris]
MASKFRRIIRGEGSRSRREATPQPPPPPQVPRDPQYPEIIFQDEEHREKFLRFKKREVLPTRFLDVELLSKLGLTADFKEFMKVLGMEALYNSDKARAGPVTHVHFRLLNQEHSLSLREFAGVLRLQVRVDYYPPDHFKMADTYVMLTWDPTPFDIQHCHWANFHHPIFSIWIRFMAQTLLGRFEGHLVRGAELVAIASYIAKGSREQFQYNLAHHVAIQFERISNSLPKPRDDGSWTSRRLVNGGLITLFAPQIAGFDETQRTPVLGPTLIDLTYLNTLKVLNGLPDHRFQWVIRSKKSLILPDSRARLRPRQANYLLPIEGVDLAAYADFRRGRLHFCSPPPPPHTDIFDFTSMMSTLGRMETGMGRMEGLINANTATLAGHGTRIDQLYTRIDQMGGRMDTLANDQHYALYPLYDDYCRRGIIEQTAQHPSWYHWNPSYGPPTGQSDDMAEDEEEEPVVPPVVVIPMVVVLLVVVSSVTPLMMIWAADALVLSSPSLQ